MRSSNISLFKSNLNDFCVSIFPNTSEQWMMNRVLLQFIVCFIWFESYRISVPLWYHRFYLMLTVCCHWSLTLQAHNEESNRNNYLSSQLRTTDTICESRLDGLDGLGNLWPTGTTGDDLEANWPIGARMRALLAKAIKVLGTTHWLMRILLRKLLIIWFFPGTCSFIFTLSW